MSSDPAWWETAVTVGRSVNIGLSAVALVVLFLAVRSWRLRSAGNRFLWGGVALLLVASLYGSAEQLVQSAPGGWRTAATTVALGWTLAGLVSKLRGNWWEDARELR